MGILEKLFILFIFTFPTGVIARLQFSNGLAISINDLILMILILFWVFYRIKLKSFEGKYYLSKPIGIFIFLGLFSLILNFPNLGFDKFLISFTYLARFIGYALLYFIVKDFTNSFKIKINKYLLISGLIVLILGYIQYFFYPSLKSLSFLGWDIHLYRMVSVFLDPNFAGTFFNIYLIFSLEFFRKRYKKLSKVKISLFLLIPIFTLFSIYLTYSRSALIMLFICTATYLILLNKKKLIIISTIVLFLLIFISPRAFQTEGTNLLRIVSTTERIQSVQIVTKVISANPLFGVGFNAYRYAQNKLGLDNVYWQVTHAGAGTDASLLFVIATTGFIGLLAFLYLIYKLLYLAKLNLNKNGIILFSVLVGLLANSLFINSFFFVFILEWIWILSGVTENS